MGTVKKSMEASCETWLVRNVRQVRDGGVRGRRLRYFATVAWEISRPSMRSSPWMRGAPQRGFAACIWRIRVRRSAATAGRPVPLGRDLQRQSRAKPRRCQRTTVSGDTICTAWRHSDHVRDSTTQTTRSSRWRRSRTGAWRRRTASWWRNANTSAASAARERTMERRAASRATTSAIIGIGKRTDPCAEALRTQDVSSFQ